MLMNFLAATKYPAENVLSVDEAISEGIFTTVYGISTVFAVLLVTMVCIIIMRFFFSLSEKKENNAVVEVVPVEIPVETVEVKNDAEIIAVITAAICASTGASQSDIIIRSFRRVGRENSWGSMGIKDQLNKSL